jgi:hypothetical protein
MPRRQEPKKDVANDEMPRGAVSEHRSGGVRMGKPASCKRDARLTEYIGKDEADQGN